MFNSGCISLMKTDSMMNPIANLFDSIVYQRKEGHEFGDVIFKDLEPGTYQVQFKKIEVDIVINVHKGVYWESEEYILTHNKLITNQIKKSMCRITDYSIDSEESKENPSLSKVSFKVDGSKKELKVHVFASNTMFTHPYLFVNQYRYLHYNYASIINFSEIKNQYLCNKKLGDEIRYALERKYLKNFIGTTLEKPSLLYKRNFYGGTYFDAAGAAQEQGYSNVIKNEAALLDPTSILSGGSKKKKKMRGHSGGIAYIPRRLDAYPSEGYPYYFNFNDTPPLVIANLKEEKGVYSFKIDTSLYSNITILAIDSYDATQKHIDIEKKDGVPQLKTRKIELDKPLDSKESYQETRNAI